MDTPAEEPGQTPAAGPTAPPGWYPDPEGGEKQRYWDGNQWTTRKPVGGNCLGIVVGGVVLLCGGGWVLSLLGGDDVDEGTDVGAEIACEDFVEARLRSPGTADFSGEEVTGAHSTFTVSGAVDSENAFGGVVRNTYVCTARYAGDDRWNLVDLEMTNN